MVGGRVSGTAHGIDRFQGAPSASGGQSRPRHHTQRRGSPYLSIARQARYRRHRPHLAGPGLPPRRSQSHVTSSISRRLIFWLAVPLMLLALCGALVHYFNSVPPGVIDSDRRLKEAANVLMAHVQVKDGQVTLDAAVGTDGKPSLPAPDSIKYALRYPQGHLLAGDPQLPAVVMNSETSQLF